MITLSQIDASLSLYRSHQVILWGQLPQLQSSLTLLREHGIQPVGICSPTPSLWGTHIHFLPVWSLEEVASRSTPTLLQLTLEDWEEEYLLLEKIVPLFSAPHQKLVRHGELHAMLPFFRDLDQNKNTAPDSLQREWILRHRALTEQQKALAFFHRQEREALFLCMPPKTGDHSLMDTLTQQGIPHHFVFHNPDFWEDSLFLDQGKKIKLITALREPRAQELSLLYQIVGDLSQSLTARFLLYGRYDRTFFQEGGDAQTFFTLLCDSFAQGDPYQAGEQSQFYQRFQRSIRPLPSFPKEQGYCVYTFGELEIFLYQLEKLNQIVPQLASFVGGTFQTLVRSNEAEKKWIASSYEQAKQSLLLSPAFQSPPYQQAWYERFYGQKGASASSLLL